MNPEMHLQDRVHAALRARFWLHFWHQHIAGLSKKFPDLYSMSRSFISPASFHIFNRLCDTLVLLALAYSEYYPTTAFCPWLIDTGFVEHFFGIARQLLPNFSYAEFVKMAQHIMVRQRILESGLIRKTVERDSAVGYSFKYDPATDMRSKTPLKDQDDKIDALCPSTLSRSDLKKIIELAYKESAHICNDILFMPAPVNIPEKGITLFPLGSVAKKIARSMCSKSKENHSTGDDLESDNSSDSEGESDLDDEDEDDSLMDCPQDIDEATAAAASSSARYSALSQDLESVVNSDTALVNMDRACPSPHQLHGNDITPAESTISHSNSSARHGTLFNPESGYISTKRMIEVRNAIQSGTATKSERTVTISSRYTALEKVSDSTDMEGAINSSKRITSQEASQRLRVAQDTNTILKKEEQKKLRQIRWQSVSMQLKKDLKKVVNDIPLHLSERGVTALNDIHRGVYLIMRSSTPINKNSKTNSERFYIGQVLDIYKKGQSSRYGSVERQNTLDGLAYISLRVYLALGITVSITLSEPFGYHLRKLIYWIADI